MRGYMEDKIQSSFSHQVLHLSSRLTESGVTQRAGHLSGTHISMSDVLPGAMKTHPRPEGLPGHQSIPSDLEPAIVME